MKNLKEKVEKFQNTFLEALFEDNFQGNKDQIVKSLSNFHSTYSSNRKDFSKLNINLFEASSYALYYGVVNAAKVSNILDTFPDNFKPKNVLDFGCGPITALMAALESWDSISMATLVEHSAAMRQVAQKILNHTYSNVAYNCFNNLDQLPIETKYDLILAANSLNELSSGEYEKTFFSLLNKINDHGILCIIEPGSVDITRKLMGVREVFCANDALTENYSILYPCTHNNACKLLEQPSQWCHSDMLFPKTEIINLLDKALGLNKHTISYSSFVLQKNKISTDKEKFRIITEPKQTKVGSTAYICGNRYQGLVTLQKRDRTEQNRHFGRLKMHDCTDWIDKFRINESRIDESKRN